MDIPRKRHSNGGGHDTPAKKSNTTEDDCLEMAKKLKSKEYYELAKEMRDKRRSNKYWDSDFRYKVEKDFDSVLHNAYEIASEYRKLVQENLGLKKSLQEEIARTSELKTSNKALKSQVETQKEKINEYEMEKSMLEEEIEEEKEKRMLAEKTAEEALEKGVNENILQNDLSQITHKIDALQDNVGKLQNITAENVVPGIQNLSTNMCHMFPAAKKEGPAWLVPKKICDSIYDSAQGNPHTFIPLFLPNLFGPAELILPLKEIKKAKKDEFGAVYLHFFKLSAGEDEVKNVIESLFKKEMDNLRKKERLALYKKMDDQETMAITLSKEYIFYSNDPKTGRMLPRGYNDDGLLYADIYGIPPGNAEDEFIIIVQKSDSTGVFYKRIIPSSGYVQVVYSHLKKK